MEKIRKHIGSRNEVETGEYLELSRSQEERFSKIVTPESVAQVGLTEVIVNNHDQVIDPKQRYVSRDQFLDLLAHAVSLRDYELNRKIGSNLDHKLIDSDIGINNGNLIPENALYSAADYVSLPREYVDKALIRYSLSNQQKQLDVGEVNSKPSFDNMGRVYKNIILNKLREEMPLSSFKTSGKYLGDYGGSFHSDSFFFSVNEEIFERREIGL